ncbi:hypothetical protein AOLI_G00230420 [Acnodon oligacanthus]
MRRSTRHGPAGGHDATEEREPERGVEEERRRMVNEGMREESARKCSDDNSTLVGSQRLSSGCSGVFSLTAVINEAASATGSSLDIRLGLRRRPAATPAAAPATTATLIMACVPPPPPLINQRTLGLLLHTWTRW